MNNRARDRIAEEQASLRRIAMLVARGAAPERILEAVAEEAGRLLEVTSTGVLRFDPGNAVTLVAGWGRFSDEVLVGTHLPLGGTNVATEIARTGRSARYDRDVRATGALGEHARGLNVMASAGSPITVEGRLWGAMTVAAAERSSLPGDIELRLAQFTELVGTAIANAEARREAERLAEEQAALRRVATLVAHGTLPAAILDAVAEEAGRVLDVASTGLFRFESGDSVTLVAGWGRFRDIRIGARFPLGGTNVATEIARTGRPARYDPDVDATGALGEHARSLDVVAAAGSPIVVDGRLWGVMTVAAVEGVVLAADVEVRLAQFTELVATAIANTEAHAEVERLAEEQAALRRVATLVARGATPTQVFEAVVVEMAHLLGAAQVGLMRSENPDEATIVAARGPWQAEPEEAGGVRVGMRVRLDGENVTARVIRTGRSARLDRDGLRGGTIAEMAQRGNVNVTVGAPIVIEGGVWGAMAATWIGDDVPAADAEERLAEFAEMVGTAIANADSRDQLEASRVRVLTAGDEARRRVARDLHDGAQQRLVHTILTLKLARRAMGENPERAESLLAEALDHAEHGNADLRELVHGILPAVLARGGLEAGVDSLVSRLDLPVEVDVTAERLPSEIEANAYFTVAEALTNVVKHSQTKAASVTASVDGGILRIEIRDQGIGGADLKGHGLLGLSDRMAAFGGTLTVDSPRGTGTAVVAELPVPR